MRTTPDDCVAAGADFSNVAAGTFSLLDPKLTPLQLEHQPITLEAYAMEPEYPYQGKHPEEYPKDGPLVSDTALSILSRLT